jgi:hypothetical protein
MAAGCKARAWTQSSISLTQVTNRFSHRAQILHQAGMLIFTRHAPVRASFSRSPEFCAIDIQLHSDSGSKDSAKAAIRLTTQVGPEPSRSPQTRRTKVTSMMCLRSHTGPATSAIFAIRITKTMNVRWVGLRNTAEERSAGKIIAGHHFVRSEEAMAGWGWDAP